MNYVITGGAGFIGSNLVERLLKEGHKTIILDNFSTGKKENLGDSIDNPNLVIYKKDICEDLSEIFKENPIEAIFHLAAIPRVQLSINDPINTHRTNVEGTFNLLMHCYKYGIKRFVFSSSSSVYGDQDKLPFEENMKPNPMSPYALHKLIGEEYCNLFNKIYGLETISLRYFNVYGPKMDPLGDYALLIAKFILKIMNNEKPTINGDGQQTRDFTYVEDIIEANLIAAKTQNKNCFGKTFNIGAGKNYSVNQVTKEINILCNKNIEPIHGPPVIEPKDTLSEIKLAEQLLGWKPKVDFKQGLRKTYEYLLRK